MRLDARLGCCFVILGTSLAAHSQSAAADWRLIRKPQSAAAPMPAAEPGHVTYLRRLVRDANAAAERGDHDEARRIAERAYQVSVSYQAILSDKPDCSPATLAALAQRYGSTIGMARTRSSAQPSSSPPTMANESPAPPPDLLALVEARFRKASLSRTESSPTRTATPQSPHNELKSTQAEWRPAVSKSAAKPADTSRPTTPAQPISDGQTIVEQPFQQSPDFKATNRTSLRSHSRLEEPDPTTEETAQAASRPTPAPQRLPGETTTGGPVNDPAVKSALGGENNAWKLDLNAGDDAEEGSASSVATPLPPAPPASGDVEAAVISTPATSRTDASSLNEASLQGDGSTPCEAALEETLKLTASPLPQQTEASSFESDANSDELGCRWSKGLSKTSVQSARPGAAWRPDDNGNTSPRGVIHTPSRSAEFAWPTEFGERVVLATAIAMLIGGFAAFSLSFRRA